MSQVDELERPAVFVVARGDRELLDGVRALVGGYAWVRVIEDRRREPTLLPREGRQGKRYVGP